MIHPRCALFKYYITQDRQCTYNIILMCVRVTIVAVEMQYVLHIMSECVCVFVALGIQHAMCVSRILIYGVRGSAIFLQGISYRYDFRKNVIERKMLVLIFSKTFTKYFSF